jgi:outer membrane protein
MIWRNIVLASFAFWSPLAVEGQITADTSARPISLEEAVRLAQQNNPSTVQARGAIRTGEAAVRTAYGSFLPTLNVNSSGSKQGGETFFQGALVPYRGDPWSFSRGLSSSIELFDGGRRFNNLRSARATVTSAESNERLQRFTVALSVKQQFFDVLAARESRAAALTQLEQAQQQLKASTARVLAGAATKSDSLRSEIQVGNARLAVLTAETSLRNANAALTRLVGTPFFVTASSSDSLAPGVVVVDSTQLARMIETAPVMQQAEAEYTAARSATRAAKSPYWPTLSMNMNYTGNNTDKSFDFGGGTYAYQNSIRFQLSYPIFNGFTREENVARASVAETNANAALRDARLQVQQSLTQSLGALQLAQERIEIQNASVLAAEEDLRVQQQRYALGASTLLDVLTSQTTLNQARAALIQARYDARVAKAQIEALIGQDLK